MRFFTKALLWFTLALACTFRAGATGWPAEYQGVMLQGFYWDSYSDTKWTTLESQADELSRYFDLIWIPNSGYSGGHNNMGYLPQYWFTNHNSSFGTEAELRSMIRTFRDKGTGIIADVVINHRAGVSNWTDFPAETWNGRTWHIGTDGICCTDEVAGAQGQARPTGNPDTGDDFNGGRDLDHTNANVQDNCKNYCKFLLEDLGYAGFRYDMVKGYAPEYTKMYNQYSRPSFSVGEYWDGSYDKVRDWIEGTGRESAAFDFPCKFLINEAFHSGDLTKLVWYANGDNPQPAGMIHFGYPQYAVTFVDNHDTYREGTRFNGNVVAANAFILFSPGTPCVFLPHYQQYKQEIQRLIDLRKEVGISNTSTVRVLKSAADCYMAEITGTNGKAVVKVGYAYVSPDGYSNDDIKTSGDAYCVWTKTGGTPGPGPDPEKYCVYFNNTYNWDVKVWAWNDGGNCNANGTWPGDAMTVKDGKLYWEAPAGKVPTMIIFSNNGGEKAGGGDLVFVNGATYNPDGSTVTDVIPENLWILGNLEGEAGWTSTPGTGVAMTRDGNTFTARGVKFIAYDGETHSYFNITDHLGQTWDELNAGANRFGAVTEGETVASGSTVDISLFARNVNASDCKSWKVLPGTYNLVADMANKKLTVSKNTGIDDIAADNPEAETAYYTLQGVRVSSPTPGLYIAVRGGKATKVMIR